MCCVVFRGSIGVSYVIPVMNDASFQVSDLASAINNSASRTRCSGGCCTAPAPPPRTVRDLSCSKVAAAAMHDVKMTMDCRPSGDNGA